MKVKVSPITRRALGPVAIALLLIGATGCNDKPTTVVDSATTTTLAPVTTAPWTVVASGGTADTTWKVEVQSDAEMTCTLVRTENSRGVGSASSCGATKRGAASSGTLQSSMADILDDHGKLLTNVAVAVAGPHVQGVVFTLRSPEGSTSSLSSDGKVVPITTGGSLKVFVAKLDAPAGARISAEVRSTG